MTENLSFLHPYWHNFEKVSSTYHITIGIMMVFVTIGAVAGNGLVVWSFVSFRSLRTSSNVFIINLSVANLMMSLIDFPLLIIASFIQDWPFGKTVCDVYATLTGLCGLVTINSLTVIAVDRYRAIVMRVNSADPAPKWKTYKATLVIWTYAFIWAISPVMGWNKYQLEGVRTTCTFDYLTRDKRTISFIVAIATFEFIIPVIVIILAYFKIVTAMIVRRRNLSMSKHSENASLNIRMQRYRVRAEIRTALIIIGLVCLFVVSWLPYTVTAMIGLFGDQSLITPYLSSVAGLVAKTSTVFNPIVYAIIHPKFKTKIKSLVYRQSLTQTGPRSRVNSRISSNKFSTSGNYDR
ncbi:rhodopsin-like [Saccostrea echinata]|uniref:rhodopsin-like n=1 Tax=Saccostrea echinata TaxID=191078 RepID=UPI002A804332|nr:rhodopsin-like [Saccostrea echinata]